MRCRSPYGRCSGPDRQAGLGPVLDALGVLADVGVAELLEFHRDLSAVAAGRVGAVGDDGGVLVRQEFGGPALRSSRKIGLTISGGFSFSLATLGSGGQGDDQDRTRRIELPVLGVGMVRERADAARNRLRVLAAAERLFSLRGVAGVTMDDVAGEAGVGKGTLYRRFGDKGGLAVALLDERERELQQQLLDGAPPPGPRRPGFSPT